MSVRSMLLTRRLLPTVSILVLLSAASYSKAEELLMEIATGGSNTFGSSRQGEIVITETHIPEAFFSLVRPEEDSEPIPPDSEERLNSEFLVPGTSGIVSFDQDSPGFDAVVDVLTNGAVDAIGRFIGYQTPIEPLRIGGGTVSQEGAEIMNQILVDTGEHPDLYNYSIDRIDLEYRLADWTITYRLDGDGDIVELESVSGRVSGSPYFNVGVGFLAIWRVYGSERPPNAPRIEISFEGGKTQECLLSSATNVGASADIQTPEGDPLLSVEWFLNGQLLGTGQSTIIQVPLGVHSIEAVATTVSGISSVESKTISVVDTTPPDISYFFTNHLGELVSSISRKGLNTIQFSVSVHDLCDESPTYHAMSGVEIHDGSVIEVQASLDEITVKASKFSISVEANDLSGNTSFISDTLEITD